MERGRPNSAVVGVAVAALMVLPAVALAGGSGGTPTTGGQPADAQSVAPVGLRYRPAVATWYGPGFFGRRTACGLKLTRRTLGVAHRRLPCGTPVALRYRHHALVVPVVDRGPYTPGIDLDLTSAAARRLGLSGTARVRAATVKP
jgi:rare lipoprotein A (peptidoglycan hydrolase)